MKYEELHECEQDLEEAKARLRNSAADQNLDELIDAVNCLVSVTEKLLFAVKVSLP